MGFFCFFFFFFLNTTVIISVGHSHVICCKNVFYRFQNKLIDWMWLEGNYTWGSCQENIAPLMWASVAPLLNLLKTILGFVTVTDTEVSTSLVRTGWLQQNFSLQPSVWSPGAEPFFCFKDTLLLCVIFFLASKTVQKCVWRPSMDRLAVTSPVCCTFTDMSGIGLHIWLQATENKIV